MKRGRWVEIVGFLAIAVFVIGVVWLIATPAPPPPPPQTGIEVGVMAPDFTLKTLNGDTFKLSDQRGKVVVLEFMFTTCPHCVNEMSQLALVYANSKAVMISVSINQGDTDDVLRAFIAQHGASWMWARDTAGVSSQYQVQGVPMILIIDTNGRIAQIHAGETSASTLIQEILEAVV